MSKKVCLIFLSYGPPREKTCLRGVANSTGADQPAHPRSLISAFVIRDLESTIYKLATSEILVSLAEETGFSLTLSETPKTGFLATRPISIMFVQSIKLFFACTSSSPCSQVVSAIEYSVS